VLADFFLTADNEMKAATLQGPQLTIRLVFFSVYEFFNIILPPYTEKYFSL